jgi:ureidoacrylate peracid hydrolase
MPKALLVVDVQKIYTNPDSEMYCDNAKATVKKINNLIEGFNHTKEPIIFVRHTHSADGSDLGRMFDYTGEAEEDFNFKAGTEEVEYDDNLLKPENPGEVVKHRYSAFIGTDLDKRLKKAGVDTVVVCGFMTNFCCESTARGAHDRDYFVDFVVDATGTPGTDHLDQKEIRKVVAELLEAGFARVKTTKEFLEEK